MQAFCPYKSIRKIIKVFDRKRHNNQINEAMVIMKVNSGFTMDWKDPYAWKNHPNVKLWDGKQIFWLYKYTKMLLKSYKKKYNISVTIRLFKLYNVYFHITQRYKKPLFVLKPKHLTKEFCKKHQQILLEKDYEHYKKYFGG
jgi:hypothetical protein